MGSRQGQDLANDGLQMAAAQEARRHASTVRLRCGADPLLRCPCGCLIFISDTRKDARFGMSCCWRGGRWTFGCGEPPSPLIFPHAFLVEGSTRCCFVLVGKSEVILPPTLRTRCRCSLKTRLFRQFGFTFPDSRLYGNVLRRRSILCTTSARSRG
jgi:hypothetical protein